MAGLQISGAAAGMAAVSAPGRNYG